MEKSLIYLCFVISFLSASWIYGQEQVEQQSQSLIKVHYSESGSNLMDSLISKLMGNVVLSKDSAFMYCDTAILRNRKILVAYGNVSILQSDTLRVFCDSLYYHADSTQAYLYDNVLLQNGSESMKTSYLEYDIKQKIAEYFDGATLTRGSTILNSRKGKYFVGARKAEFFKHVQVVDSSFQLRTDSLYYNLQTEKVTFNGPSRIQTEDAQLYCEFGFYFLDSEDGYFERNAQYLKEDSRATADIIFYHGELKDVVLEGNARYIEEDKEANAIKIVFNEETEDAVLSGDAYFKDEERTIFADVILYNAAEERIETKGRATVLRDSTRLVADLLKYNDNAGTGYAEGDVVWTDMENDLEIFCDLLSYLEEPERITAKGENQRPLLVRMTEKDSLYLSADSLIMMEVIDSLDTLDFFVALSEVRVLNRKMTASADSLVYSDRDSTYSLFHDPYIWSDTTQFSADTIHLVLKDEAIDRVFLRSNSFVITENKEKVHDQIKGKNMDIYFVENDLSHMTIRGSSESVYYVRDDAGDFLGVNKTECSSMKFIFADGELKDIKFLANPTSKLIPISSSQFSPVQLDGFNWNGRNKTTDKNEMRSIHVEIR